MALTPEQQQKNRERLATEIRAKFKQAGKEHWPEIIRLTGLQEVLDSLTMPSEEDLANVDEADWDVLKKTHFKHLKLGMEANNAQMHSVFQRADKERQGADQIQGLVVMVTPATVPDDMTEFLHVQMKELTEIASRS